MIKKIHITIYVNITQNKFYVNLHELFYTFPLIMVHFLQKKFKVEGRWKKQILKYKCLRAIATLIGCKGTI